MSNEVGQILDGKITSITKFGAFVSLPDNKSGLIHISEISDGYVKDINDHLSIGQNVKVRVCSVDENGRLSLSLKQMKSEKQDERKTQRFENKKRIVPDEIRANKSEPQGFEDMMSQFLKTSNEKISDLKKTVENKRGSGGFSRKNTKKY